MKALVLYDSVYGNTEKAAQAIAAALGDGANLMRVSDADGVDFSGYTHVILGSPTQAFSALKSVKAFLAGLPAGCLKGKQVAAFDTRMDVKEVKNGCLTIMAGLFGYAAEPMAKQLVSKGGTLAGKPLGVIVLASEGPLRDGELERAAAWAKALVGVNE